MKRKSTTKSKTIKAKTSGDQYDPADWDESQSVEVTPETRLKNGISTSIRLPTDMIKKLRRIASKKGDIGYQTLIKIWIAERLEQETLKRVI